MTEAYRLSYDCTRMKKGTIYRKAFEVYKRGYVTAKIAELRAEAAQRNEITIDKLQVKPSRYWGLL